MAFEEQIVEFLEGLFPDWFITIFVGMLPIIELRGALPWAYFKFEFPLSKAFLLSILGNMIPVPFILYLFKPVEKWLRKRWGWWDRTFEWLFKRTRKRYKKWWGKYGDIALIVFVGIPAPMTGAWTGCLISYLFKMDKKRSFYIIFVGVWMAGVIVSALCVFFAWLILSFFS